MGPLGAGIWCGWNGQSQGRAGALVVRACAHRVGGAEGGVVGEGLALGVLGEDRQAACCRLSGVLLLLGGSLFVWDHGEIGFLGLLELVLGSTRGIWRQ